LPGYVRLFAQSSKDGVLPRKPVLLIRDSYAQGKGDWLLAADPNRNEAFHSAHLIKNLTGRDVVSLGHGGMGSAEAIVAMPATAYAYSKRALYLRLPKPMLPWCTSTRAMTSMTTCVSCLATRQAKNRSVSETSWIAPLPWIHQR
jgi:hypothetical protein